GRLEHRCVPCAPAALAADLRAAARAALGGEPDVWHIHNHSLGKNVHLPGALRLLAEEGARLLLQLHDFAEDGRPENYRRLQAAYPERRTFAHSLYPASPAVHYAVLNGRDEAALRTAGVPDGRRHLLPNPVAVPALTDDAPPPELPPGTERLILYPTRAIRRKNLGELLLHAALSPAGTLFATTLRPENPEWRAIHGRWEALAGEWMLPVAFGLGETCAFDALMHRADALITTSVAEGFGLAFLEPALFDKPLVGRDLPEITGDFAAWGVRLGALYERLPVALTAAEEGALRKQVAEGLERLAVAYARPCAPDALERALDAMRDPAGHWDFGRLDEALQASVIRRAVAAPEAFPAARAALEPVPTSAEVAAQRAAVETHLALPAYGARLAALYRALRAEWPVAPAAHDASALLDTFLAPERLSLLRS
ncbi:MAG: hypothetical protein ACLFU2_03480, partial [Opitutales bacterium]